MKGCSRLVFILNATAPKIPSVWSVSFLIPSPLWCSVGNGAPVAHSVSAFAPPRLYSWFCFTFLRKGFSPFSRAKGLLRFSEEAIVEPPDGNGGMRQRDSYWDLQRDGQENSFPDSVLGGLGGLAWSLGAARRQRKPWGSQTLSHSFYLGFEVWCRAWIFQHFVKMPRINRPHSCR